MGVQLLPLEMLRKVHKNDSDLILSESNVFGFSGSATRVKEVVALSIKVESKKSHLEF